MGKVPKRGKDRLSKNNPFRVKTVKKHKSQRKKIPHDLTSQLQLLDERFLELENGGRLSAEDLASRQGVDGEEREEQKRGGVARDGGRQSEQLLEEALNETVSVLRTL